jgi:hypothetical protein
MASADQVDCAVERDPVDPGSEARPGVETGEPAVGFEEGLLNDVFRVFLVAGHAVGQAKDHRAVLLDQGPEGVHLRHPGRHRPDLPYPVFETESGPES